MAFNVTNLTDYSSKSKDLFVTQALLDENLERYPLHKDVQYSKLINKAEVTTTPQAGGCELSSSGGTKFTEVELKVTEVAFPIKYCYKDLVKKAFDLELQGYEYGFEEGQIQEKLTQAHIDSIKADLEDLMWTGDVGSGDLTDGFWTIADDDADTQTIDSTYGDLAQSGITTTNIDDYIQAFISKAIATEDIWANARKGNHFVIHVAPNIYDLYKQYQISENLVRDADKELATSETYITGYKGLVTIKEEPSLTVDDSASKPKVLATYDNNLVRGTNLLGAIDVPEVRWVYKDAPDNTVWFYAQFMIGFEIMEKESVILNYKS